jgi:hypothetical protein
MAGKLISKVGFAEFFKPLQNSCLSLIVDYCPLFSFSTLTSICVICRWPFSLGTHSIHKEIGFAEEWSIFGLFSKGIFTQKCSGYDGFNIQDNSSTWCKEEFPSRGGLRLAIFGMISA